MQHPVGYTIDAETGQARLDDFLAVLSNPYLVGQFSHTILASWTTGAFLVLGISAYYLFRQREVEVFTSSARVAVTIAVLSSIGVAFVGHDQAQHLTDAQPMKLAAAEALWDTEEGAALSLFAVGDVDAGRNVIDIGLPQGLSILATNELDGEVQGLNDLQAAYEEEFGAGDYLPPVGVTYWSFRIMVGAGMLMIALALFGVVSSVRGRIADTTSRLNRWWLWSLPFAIALPFLANTAGWILTEMGRQPWVVYGVLRTSDGVSPSVSTWEVVLTLGGFTAIYLVLLAVTIGLIRKQVRTGPPEESDEEVDEDHRTIAPLGAY